MACERGDTVTEKQTDFIDAMRDFGAEACKEIAALRCDYDRTDAQLRLIFHRIVALEALALGFQEAAKDAE